jgi:glycosyltransferase involved in cell wall biosynthesis
VTVRGPLLATRDPRSSICLNMIIKNEAPVLARCLDSVLPFIDSWLVVDTGSGDGTQDQVRRALNAKPGVLYDRPWRDFASNRTEALSLARERADYLLFIDADERLEIPPNFQRSHLDADAYYLTCDYSGISYQRAALVATRLPWRWEGVVHETLACDQEYHIVPLDGPRIVVAHDGARSRDPNTYAADAALLEAALRSDPANTRNAFYLAQSLRDSGQLVKSRDAYLRRAGMGGWEEEVWYSLFQSALLNERLGARANEVPYGYLAAYEYRPTRAEPLVELARYHRQRGQHALALLYARSGAALARPSDLLFLDESVYSWRALDELSVAAYYVGAHEDGRLALERLLSEERVPTSERERLLKNRRFFQSS